MSSDDILFRIKLSNIRLKQVLKLHKLFVESQILLGPRYPVICGVKDYPSTMDICRLTQLDAYEVYLADQAVYIDMERLDRLLGKSGNTVLTRYKRKPDLISVQQSSTSSLFEISDVPPQEKIVLDDYIMIWQTRCIRGIASKDVEAIIKQIVNANLSEDQTITLVVKKDWFMIDFNNELSASIKIPVIKPERWLDGTDKGTAASQMQCESSIEIDWRHFIKYLPAIHRCSEVRFYTDNEKPFLMLEMMLQDKNEAATIEYGSLRFIMREGIHDEPSIGYRPRKKKTTEPELQDALDID